MHYGVDGPVYSATVLRGRAEILTARLFLVVGHVDGVTYQFVHSFILAGRDWNHRNTK